MTVELHVFRLLNFSYHRLYYLFICAPEALWKELSKYYRGGWRVCARNDKILLSVHYLQKPSVCLSLTIEVRQPEIVCQGKDSIHSWHLPCSLSSTCCVTHFGCFTVVGQEHCRLCGVPGFRWQWRISAKGLFCCWAVCLSGGDCRDENQSAWWFRAVSFMSVDFNKNVC